MTTSAIARRLRDVAIKSLCTPSRRVVVPRPDVEVVGVRFGRLPGAFVIIVLAALGIPAPGLAQGTDVPSASPGAAAEVDGYAKCGGEMLRFVSAVALWSAKKKESGRPYDTGLLKSEQGAADSTCGVVVEVMGGVLGTRDRETGELVWQRTRLLFEIPLERKSIKRIAILSEDGKPLPLAVDPALVEGSDYVTGATVTRAEVYVEHSPGFTFRLRLYP